MIKKLKENPKCDLYLNIVFSAFLLLYPLRHIRLGAEWWDTGYNYGNFTYMDHMDDMWLFSTYLGNALGNWFTRLPLGNTMIGLNLYTSLLVSLMAVAGYWFFVKSIKLPKVLVFMGEFLAVSLCWCPTALLYNYLTYVLLGAGGVLLYYALMDEKRSRPLFVLAGICLGINVFVRFSNLANMGLIVAVWAMGVIRKEKPGKVIGRTMWCILGYGIGLGGGFWLISLQYGATAYIQGVLRLLSMPSEASSYTIYSMVYSQYRNYLQNLIWLGYLAFLCLIGMLVYQIPVKKGILIKKTVCVLYTFVCFYVLFRMGMFDMVYTKKNCIFQWAAMLLTATIIIGIIVIFGKKFSEQEKLLCGLHILIIVITPLGSNNHLYGSINNLFFVLPFTLWMLYRFLKQLPDRIKIGRLKAELFPLKTMVVCTFGLILLQSALFGWIYVFSEGGGGENLHTSIENNDILKGILTDEDRAEAISSITAFVKENDLKGREVILYGNIPSMSYYLEMPFAISSWPDLASYNYTVMENDLKHLQEKADDQRGELPVILMEKQPGAYAAAKSLGAEEAHNSDNSLKFEEDRKLQLLIAMLEKYDYKVSYENDKFVLFLAENGGKND